MRPNWLRVVAADDDSPAVVYLYGLIGEDWWGDGNAAIDFAKELDALSPRDIELRVNSEGGSVFEGYAMYSALNRYPGKVTAFVDGLAASAASYLILAADEVVMGEASFMMIHNAWSGGYFVGNAGELRTLVEDLAGRLDMLDEQLVDIYVKHSIKEADEIREAMAATTWLTAEQSVEWGFASRVDEGIKAAACMSAKAAEIFGRVPEGVTVVDQLTVAEVRSDDRSNIAVADAVPDGGQEPVAEARQEPSFRTVAIAGQVHTLPNRKEEGNA